MFDLNNLVAAGLPRAGAPEAGLGLGLGLALGLGAGAGGAP